MKLIEILPNVYGVKVPIDDKKYYMSGFSYLCRMNAVSGRNREILINEQLDNFRVLGFLTKDEISFDITDIYEKFSTTETAEKKFRSALPEEIYFENPLKEPKKYVPISTNPSKELRIDSEEIFEHELKQYQIAQDNITQKLLILQKL